MARFTGRIGNAFKKKSTNRYKNNNANGNT